MTINEFQHLTYNKILVDIATDIDTFLFKSIPLKDVPDEFRDIPIESIFPTYVLGQKEIDTYGFIIVFNKQDLITE